MNLRESTKHYQIFEYSSDIHVAVGKTQTGNGHLVTLYKEQEDAQQVNKVFWIHLANRPSAHAFIVVLNNTVPFQAIVKAVKEAKTLLTVDKPVHKTVNNKSQQAMICRLKDVQRTKTVGLVNVSNEKLLSDSSWTCWLQKNLN